jgi:hypothetical protein
MHLTTLVVIRGFSPGNRPPDTGVRPRHQDDDTWARQPDGYGESRP